MDCAAEESEIRRALDPVAGINGLSFQLGARTLQIDATPDALGAALLAIRNIGFEPQPVAGIKAVFLVWAVLGSPTMWMAVFADMGASLLVIANGLRLLRERAVT
jgi:cation transport ATPase